MDPFSDASIDEEGTTAALYECMKGFLPEAQQPSVTRDEKRQQQIDAIVVLQQQRDAAVERSRRRQEAAVAAEAATISPLTAATIAAAIEKIKELQAANDVLILDDISSRRAVTEMQKANAALQREVVALRRMRAEDQTREEVRVREDSRKLDEMNTQTKRMRDELADARLRLSETHGRLTESIAETNRLRTELARINSTAALCMRVLGTMVFTNNSVKPNASM